MSDLPNRVCIIGAGSSGITAAKTLKERGDEEGCEATSTSSAGSARSITIYLIDCSR